MWPTRELKLPNLSSHPPPSIIQAILRLILPPVYTLTEHLRSSSSPPCPKALPPNARP